MTRIDFDIVIDRPLDDIFAVLTDPAKTPTWSSSAEEERWTTPSPHGLGSRRLAVSRSLGRGMEYEAEVMAFEPGGVDDPERSRSGVRDDCALW